MSRYVIFRCEKSDDWTVGVKKDETRILGVADCPDEETAQAVMDALELRDTAKRGQPTSEYWLLSSEVLECRMDDDGAMELVFSTVVSPTMMAEMKGLAKGGRVLLTLYEKDLPHDPDYEIVDDTRGESDGPCSSGR
jgi:hypothetical protein